MEPLAIGQVVAGKYVIERELGRGGMGVVYVVQQRDTGKRLAMKCLLPEYVQDAPTVERFMREARAAGGIHHRNVVSVFDVGRDGHTLYLVMELLEGKPLSTLLHDETLTLEEALLILVRAMEGVAAAHAQGIIHRDIKPDNIFVTYGSDGKLDDPKVLDFGVSKSEGLSGGTLTAMGAAVGTPYYMSLEQLTGARDIDARVDVYAMGVVLYEAIAGVLPHKATNVSALAIRVMTTLPTPLQELRPDLPAGLSDAIMTAISRDRWHRQPSLRALINEIKPFAAHSGGLSVPGGQVRPLRTPRSSAVPGAPGAEALAPAGDAPFAHPPTHFDPQLAEAATESHAVAAPSMLSSGAAPRASTWSERGPLPYGADLPTPAQSSPVPLTSPGRSAPSGARAEEHAKPRVEAHGYEAEPDGVAEVAPRTDSATHPLPSTQRGPRRFIAVATAWLVLLGAGGYVLYARKRDLAAESAQPTPTAPPALARPAERPRVEATPPPSAQTPTPTAPGKQRPVALPPAQPPATLDAGFASPSKVTATKVSAPTSPRPKIVKVGSSSGRASHDARATHDAAVSKAPPVSAPPAQQLPTVGGKIPVPEEVRGRAGTLGRSEF